MQGKATKVTVREKYPIASSSKQYGAHIDAIAFNTCFIAVRDPLLEVQLLKLQLHVINNKVHPR